MSKQQHTPEPWHIAQGVVTVYRNDEEWGVRAIKHGMDECCLFYEDDDANARRIIACVNACAGISVEALEDGQLRDAIFSPDGVIRARALARLRGQ